MGRAICSSCHGAGTRISNRTISNTSTVGPTHQTITETVPCGSCGGTGWHWVADPPPPKAPRGGARAGGASEKGRGSAAAPRGSGNVGSNPAASELSRGDRWKQVFAVIGFFVVLGLAFEQFPGINPFLAFGVATVGGLLIGAYWQLILVISIIAMIVWGGG